MDIRDKINRDTHSIDNNDGLISCNESLIKIIERIQSIKSYTFNEDAKCMYLEINKDICEYMNKYSGVIVSNNISIESECKVILKFIDKLLSFNNHEIAHSIKVCLLIKYVDIY